MDSHGFKVTRHYLKLETAWRAEFKHGKGGRVIGVNSEMDGKRLIISNRAMRAYRINDFLP